MFLAPYKDDLRKIVILNPKGGCGKTTLATNIASYFSLRGPAPTLIDADPIGYTTRWLERRPPACNRINGLSIDELAMLGRRNWSFRMPAEAGPVIVDTPAALRRRDISELSYDADCILIPVLPSEFDIHATSNFIAELLVETEFDRPVAVVANRTRKNTKSLDRLLQILKSFETPTIAVLRNSQNYVHAAELGVGIYEMPHHKVKQDIEQMDLVVSWLEQLMMRSLQPGLVSRFNPLPRLFTSAAASATSVD